MNKTKLELTWMGKENRPRLEPRILLEDPEKSYHAPHRVTDHDLFDNRLIFGDNLLALKALEQEFTGKIKCILLFAKDKLAFEAVRNPIGLNDEVLARYKNPENDPGGSWESVSGNAQAGHATASQFYSLRLPSGRVIDPPKGRCWLYTKERMEEEKRAGNSWFGADGDNAPRIEKFLNESFDQGLTPETVWPATEVGTNDEAKKI
jgi:hypothetical protein